MIILPLNKHWAYFYLFIEKSESSPAALRMPFVLEAKLSCHVPCCTCIHHNVSVRAFADCDAANRFTFYFHLMRVVDQTYTFPLRQVDLALQPYACSLF